MGSVVTPVRREHSAGVKLSRAEPSRNSLAGAVGENLRRARKLARLTQEELAEKAGVSGPYVSMVENGDEASVAVYRAFAAACGVPLAELFKVIDPNLPQPLVRFLESAEADGEKLTDEEIDYLRWVTIPGRVMTSRAYGHALEMFRASRKNDTND